MAPPKLSQAQKQDILQLYSEMSNADLAARFGVSVSTIARVIKEGKDQALIQPKKSPKQLEQLDLIPQPTLEAPPPAQPDVEELPLIVEEIEPIEQIQVLEAVIGDDFEDDGDLTEEEEEGEEEEPIEELNNFAILPLHELGLPEICYLVIDKSAEIVTRPLKDFKELGLLPQGQEQCRTLPLFRNHRLARRFSNPHQRIIKMPGHLLNVTQNKLRQKGISYILFNSRVYSL